MSETPPAKRIVNIFKTASDAHRDARMVKTFEVPERAIKLIQEDPGVEKEVQADGTRAPKANAQPLNHTVTFGPLPLERKLTVRDAVFLPGKIPAIFIVHAQVPNLDAWITEHAVEGWKLGG